MGQTNPDMDHLEVVKSLMSFESTLIENSKEIEILHVLFKGLMEIMQQTSGKIRKCLKDVKKVSDFLREIEELE